MNEYIIYTAEGCTLAPNEEVEVENCQVLGRVTGSNADEAKTNLSKDNSWIEQAGFDEGEFIIQQILNNTQRNDIRTLVNYMQVYKSHFPNADNVLNAIQRLSQI